MTEEKDETKPGPVAVIAVHGVADQKRDEMAAIAVDLLLQLDSIEPVAGEKAPCPQHGYEGFQMEQIRVAVNPLDVSSISEDDAWHYQLKQHLKDYKSEGRKEIYESVRIEGERISCDSPQGTPEVDRRVHVYEMHWADVSQLQYGILNLFAAVYRLLFETTWLGQQVIGKWASFGKDVGKFSTITSLRGIMLLLHSIASLLMTRFMPVMYVLMICMLMLTSIPVLESEWAMGFLRGVGGYRGLFAVSTMVAVGAILLTLAYYFWRRIPWPTVYLVIVVACFLVGNAVLVFLEGKSAGWWAESGFAILLWLAVCLLLRLFFFPILNRAFPGTLVMGDFLMVLFTIGLVCGLCLRSDWPLLISGPLMALRFASAALPFAWIILSTAANLFLVLAMLELFTLWFRLDLPKEVRVRRRSRIRSGIVSIALPVLLVSFLNAAFFQITLVPSRLGGLDGVNPVPGRSADAPAAVIAVEEILDQRVEPIVARWTKIPNFGTWSQRNSGQDARFSDFANYTSNEMVLPFLEFVFLIILLVLGYSLWIVTPAVWAERKEVINPRDRENITSALGKNLSQGYKWIWVGQVILVFCLLFTQALFTYRGIRSGQIQADPTHGQDDPALVLVDQFLGLRRQMTEPPRVAASRTGSSGFSSREEIPHFDRDFDENKARIRRSIERMWNQPKTGVEPLQDPEQFTPPNVAPDAPVASVASERHPSMMVRNLTEAVIFLNNGPLTSALGFFILLLSIGYLFFARLADPLVAGLRGGLDMALDVVNYLHPFPKNRTARARILNRFASLVKHITEWRDPLNPTTGYSRIVIVAHSQGGVITSDLLRALSAGSVAKDNRLEALRLSPDSTEGIPIRLLTMGSPQVQLYQARFPDLFAWDRTLDPRTHHRALECWWNVYRSGDYVGRLIFRDPKDKTIFHPEVDFVMEQNGVNLPVRETCVGPGAHTQYWGANPSDSVIRKLDKLIACDDVTEFSRVEKDQGSV